MQNQNDPPPNIHATLFPDIIGLPPQKPLPVSPVQSAKAFARQQRIDARTKASLKYADWEILAIFADGPFPLDLKSDDGDRSEDIAHHATLIAIAWLALSNTMSGKADEAKLKRDRDQAYAALGLCKALIRYPNLRRQPFWACSSKPNITETMIRSAEMDMRCPRHVNGFDFSVPDAQKARTYELSFVCNPAFRARFVAYLNALAAIKRRRDPDDRLSDYRLGRPDYRREVDACIASFFPPRIMPLMLIDELRDWRGRIYNRIAGPSQVRSTKDHAMFLDVVRYTADTADALNLEGVPPLPPATASFEDMWQYLGAVEKACEARVVQQADLARPVMGPPAGAADVGQEEANREAKKYLQTHSYTNLRSLRDAIKLANGRSPSIETLRKCDVVRQEIERRKVPRRPTTVPYTDAVENRVASSSAGDVADELAYREEWEQLLRQATSDERGRLEGTSPEQQRNLINAIRTQRSDARDGAKRRSKQEGRRRMA